MKDRSHIIKTVHENSPAHRAGIQAGDILLKVGDKVICDIFDYHYETSEDAFTLTLKRGEEEYSVDIDMTGESDLGIEFVNGLMDDYRSCSNRCVFCFIDQNPKGMRDTIYFKDDDSRLSFLQGNYVTLTNMSDDDIRRVINYRMEPINISIHTMNPSLRCEMLHNRFAGESLKKIDRLYEAGIHMNGQIVLCKGINDGEELKYTIEQAGRYLPYMESISVVPVGLTKYREGLCQLEPFDADDAREVLGVIHSFQHKFYEEYGNHFIHAGDEWYIMAGMEIPGEDNYDGYMQLENGVGMVRLFLDEFHEALEEEKKKGLKHLFDKKHVLSTPTGTLVYPYIKQAADEFMAAFPKYTIHVYPITNHFFGERITVTGLITGQDLMDQLKGRELGERLLLPGNMLRADEDVFLDDVHLPQVRETLQVPIDIVKSSGRDFVETILKHR